MLHGAKDKSDGSLASTMGVPPFALKDYRVAANNYSISQVVNGIGFLKKADLQSKGVDSGSKPEGDILRELVFNLMHWFCYLAYGLRNYFIYNLSMLAILILKCS